ncbi:MAG TPA: EVE domain-containing protein [Kofleriaceae bacterium]|nr:EVE domain-containing protein [Kofleriaceae bacterium]
MVSHWLMKTEPETFGIDDLARVKVEPWTGVRNYMARNLMRDRMAVGDEVLFYHSSCEPPGVAGLARVVRTGVVDATQFDPKSPYFDADSKADEPRWICVDVEFVRKLPRLVALGELRAHPGLGGMMLLQRGARLSVQPVGPEHYAIIVGLADAPAPVPADDAKAKAKARKAPAKTTPPAKNQAAAAKAKATGAGAKAKGAGAKAKAAGAKAKAPSPKPKAAAPKPKAKAKAPAPTAKPAKPRR